MSLRHLVDFNELTKEEWDGIYTLAADIKKDPAKYSEVCKGKILATLFYEPSTRTMLSFQTAMLRLGGNVIGFDNPANSSVSKGENLKDTITIISCYADIIAMRHPQEGSALAASVFSTRPLINAGDGGHFHPTQTLIDLFTIRQNKETLSGLTVGLCGDLKNGRTVHSLLRALNTLGKNTYYLISTEELALQKHIIEQLRENGNTVYEVTSLEDCIDKLDVLYMTRIQKERFATEEQYKEQSGRYILDKEKLNMSKPDTIVLHPLPRVDEITEEVDYDSRAMYFKQVQNGLYVRMALIVKMLEAREGEETTADIEKYMDLPREQKCKNHVCITKTEKYLPLLTYKTPDGGTACMYCDTKID
ncbi:MAG: aspartate carbamoyltransferase [Clostridia bacterium]|nr:aspartate carbamoyltransferase [Clostridia bacterium]